VVARSARKQLTSSLLRHEHRRIVVSDVADPLRHGARHERASRGGMHHRPNVVRNDRGLTTRHGLEPALELVRIDDERHAIVERLDVGVCGRRDDRERLDAVGTGLGSP
jgi:hypothetical protein